MATFQLICIILIISSTLVIGGLVSSQQEDPTQLQIPQGLLQGSELLSREGKKFYGFYGIPYSQEPERFEPAELPPPSWEGIYDATNYRLRCLQVNYTNGEIEGEEDCLRVNVFTPNTKGNMSVMAFIYGGGFQNGDTKQYGPEFFLDHGLVLVTMSYRVSALGFLSTADNVLPGNLGLKDQNLALRWVQDNIQYFGGDKNRVTLFGESAGSASVSLHVVSPLSLFRHAICQSGSAIARWPVKEDPKSAAVKLAEKLGCPTSSSEAIVACLKNEKSGEEIVKADIRSSYFDSPNQFGPVVELPNSPGPKFLIEDPRAIYEEGRFNRVPLIITVNDLEGLLLNALPVVMNPEAAEQMNNNWDTVAAVACVLDKQSYSNESKRWATTKLREYYFGSKLVGNDTLLNLTDFYSDCGFTQSSRKTVLTHAKYAPVYTALLSFKGIWSQTFDMGFKTVLGMTHADDLPYFFTSYRFPQFPPGSESEMYSKLLTQLWVEFANTGEPHYTLNGREWLPVSEEEMDLNKITYLVLSNQPEFVEEPLRDRMLLWDQIEEVLETGIIPEERNLV